MPSRIARDSTPETHEARLRAEQTLTAAGVSAFAARQWCAAWVAEAARQSLPTDSPYFWDAGLGWIDAHRAFAGRQPRHNLERIAG